jgi:phosphoglycerol transferase MdoB-like AlkP superfamily enzyme
VVITIAFFTNKDGMIDTFLGYAYLLFGVALVLALGLPLLQMVGNPKSFKKVLFSLIVVVVVVGLAYVLASGDPLAATLDKEPTASTLKITDTGLIITYLLFGASVTAIIAGGIINMVKNR